VQLYKKFMNKFKKYIKDKGLSNRKVGSIVGISGQAVADIIKMKDVLNIKLRTYISIRDNLGVDLLEKKNDTS